MVDYPLITISSLGKIIRGETQIEGANFIFGNTDVIGCGWNKKEKAVFFTKNGEMLGMHLGNTLYAVLIIFAQNVQNNVILITLLFTRV